MTPERRETIILLLSSKWDAIYTPPLSRAEQGAARGEVGTLKIPCPECKGATVLRDGFGRAFPCVRCGGFVGGVGELEGRVVCSGRGWVMADQYTEREPRPPIDRDRGVAVQIVHCDYCDRGVRAERPCEHCGGSGKVQLLGDRLRAVQTGRPRPEEVFDERCPIGRGLVLFAAQHWRGLGSYDVLDDKLEALDVVMPIARKMLWLVYETGQLREGDLSAPLRRRLEFGLRYLDKALPWRLRVPRSVREAAARRHVNGETAVRIKSLRFEHGLALFEIELRFGLSRGQVLDVLGRTG